MRPGPGKIPGLRGGSRPWTSTTDVEKEALVRALSWRRSAGGRARGPLKGQCPLRAAAVAVTMAA
jgi:hypothetical protein